MELRRFLHVLRTRLFLIVCVFVISVGTAIAVGWTRTAVYEAHTQLFVSTRGVPADPGATYEGGLFAQERVLSYAQIVTSPQILQPVIRKLHLAGGVRALAPDVTATVPTNTVLLNIAVRDRSAVLAASIARTVAGSFISYVSRLERPRAGSPSTVKVSVTEPAQVPTSPVSPRKALIVAVGCVVGLILAIGAALVGEIFGRRVRDETEIEESAGVPVLGVVSASRRTRTLARNSRQGIGTYLLLSAAVRGSIAEDGPRSIVVCSATESGASATIAANLAVAFVETGYKVVCVEANFDAPRIGALFGLDLRLGLSELISGEADLAGVAAEWPGESRLHVIAAGNTPPSTAALFGSRRFAELIDELEGAYEAVVISAPPLLGSADAPLLAGAAAGCLLVVRDETKMDDILASAHALTAVRARLLGLVLNRRSGRGRPPVPRRSPPATSPTVSQEG